MTPRTPLKRAAGPGARLLHVAALAALALALLAPMTGPRIERASGPVEIGSGEPPIWRAARAGDALAPGDAVRTGRDGRAEIALPAGSVRLYGDSLLRLPMADAAADGRDAVGLDKGSSLFDVLHRTSDTFEVRTPEVVVSIKGTRFLVAAGERPEVAVFRGTVGLREEQGPAHELLVREGFAAVGGAGAPFELVWSGAPDPWDAWGDGASPPPAPGPAGAGIAPGAFGVESAKAAARANGRRDAVEQAIERHPDLAGRVEKAIDAQAGTSGPAAPDLDPVVDSMGKDKQDLVTEQYVESLLNAGSGGGASSGGGAPGAAFDVTLQGDAVLITRSGQSWTFDEDALEAIKEGEASFPQVLEDSITAQGDSPEKVAKSLLNLIDD